MRVCVREWLARLFDAHMLLISHIALCVFALAMFTRGIIAYFHLNLRCVRIFDPTVFAISSSCVT